MGNEDLKTESTMDGKKPTKSGKRKSPKVDVYDSYTHSAQKVMTLQLFCGAAVIAGLWIVPSLLGVNLIQQPLETLKILVGLSLPVSLVAFSLVPLKPRSKLVPAWWAIVRGILSLPVGVLFAAFMAIVFGATLPVEYAGATKMFYWAILMSVLVVVPGATVLGSSRPSWHRIFACSSPIGPVEIAVCIPAHGAAIGAWVGAWPMPLDWERPWQQWEVCCTYGAVGGYLVGLLGSVVWISFKLGHFFKFGDSGDVHEKKD